jgi:hypothetical protein
VGVAGGEVGGCEVCKGPPGVAGIRLTPKFNYIIIFLFVNKIL